MARRDEQPTSSVSGLEDTQDPGAADDSTAGNAPAQERRLVTEGQILGRYRLESELGEGGMATVFRATDTELRREVAVKVLFAHLGRKRELAARFQREARAAASLDHPHILQVFDVGGGRDGDPPYIVMELIDGPSLDALTKSGPILSEVVAAVGVALCGALACAHDAGIIHRDVKPANVMVADGGRLVLGDFGVAHAEGDSLVTRTGAILGTPAFMAPEQALGSELTLRSDLYSLGALLYRLATGALPYEGSTARVVASILQGGRVPAQRRNPRVGPRLGAIIEKLMAADPDDRHGSADEACAELRAVVARTGLTAQELLARYFDDAAGTEAALIPRVVAACLAEGEIARAEGQMPRALALANRVLELDPDNAEALELATREAGARRWPWGVAGVGVSLALLLGGWSAGVFDRPDDPPPPALTAPQHPKAEGGAQPEADHRAVVIDAGLDAAATDAGVETVSAAMASEESPRQREPTSSPPRHVRSGKPERSRPGGRPTAREPAPVPVRDRDGGGEIRGERRVESGTDAADAGVADAAPPLRRGTLVVTTDTWCDLFIDGERTRRHNPRAPHRYQLTAGRHRLRCTQKPSADREAHAEAVIEPGAEAKQQLRLLRRVVVTASLRRGAAVRIGGIVVRGGDSIRMWPGAYTATLLSGSGAVLGRRPVSVAASKACELRDHPELGCY